MLKTNLSTVYNIYRIPRCPIEFIAYFRLNALSFMFVSSKQIRCINMHKSNLKINPSTAWVKQLIMSPVEYSNEITREFKLLRWIRLATWQTCVDCTKNNRYKFVYERQSTNETWYRCTMGKCSARIYTLMHMELYAKGLHSVHPCRFREVY